MVLYLISIFPERLLTVNEFSPAPMIPLIFLSVLVNVLVNIFLIIDT